jgi:hypothetical protein
MHKYQLYQFFINNSWIFFVLSVWTLFWKGYSLWIASKNDSKKWFIALLIFNTCGIFEIFFIFKIAKKKWSDVKEVLTRKI